MQALFLQLVLVALFGVAALAIDADKTPTVVFMCAGDTSVFGAHELSFIHAMMHGARTVEIPFCQSAYFGHLFGKNGKKIAALAVTTGSGYVSTTSCTSQLMRYSPYEPTSIVFLGTSRFSPFKGGFDPLDRQKGCWAVDASIAKNAIGSVCVTSGAFLMESGMCTEVPTDNQCTRPNCFNFDKTTAQNKITADSSLAEAIRAASRALEFPPAPPALADGLQKWWSANEAAEEQSPPTKPHLVQCVEATINAIFHGAERDYICREYTAKLMNLPTSEAVCVQAMSAFGLLRATLNFPHVQVAIVRAASGYDMYPLRRMENDRWEQNLDYVSAEEHSAFVNASVQYAIKTATLVLVNYFLGETVDPRL